MNLNDDLIVSIVALLIGTSFFWEFLKWSIEKVAGMITGERKITLSEIAEKLDGQRKDIDALKDQMIRSEGIESEKDAVASRRRILRFNDELLRGVHHSKEYFDDILEDVRTYEDYCKSHPKFENGKTVMADRNIKRCYERCMETHDFLQ